MDSVHDLIESLYKDTLGIRQAIKDAEAQLVIDKEKQELEDQCSRHIMNKFDIHRTLLYKR